MSRHKGGARKKKLNGDSSGKTLDKKSGVPKGSLSSKVAQVLLDNEKNTQSTYTFETSDNNTDNNSTILPFKRKYTYLNTNTKPNKPNPSICSLCKERCESESIECSECNCWYHGNCLHFTERDLQIHLLCEIDFVCLLCIIKGIPALKGLTDISKALSDTSEKLQSENKTLFIKDQEAFTEQEESTETSEAEDLEVNNTIIDQILSNQLPSAKTVDENPQGGEISILCGDTSLLKEVDFTLESGAECHEDESYEQVENTIVENVTRDSFEQIVTQSQSQSSVTNVNNSTNLVIIDNIRESWKYKSSSSIKREFTKYFPDVRLSLAYSLKAGGIALHLTNRASVTQILGYTWPVEAFGYSGAQLYCHTSSNRPKVILKNIDTTLSEEDLELIIQNFTREQVQIKRFHYRDTGKRLPVVKVTCSQAASDQLIKKSLTIHGRSITAEVFKSIHRREIICFNCREKGHIARSCPLLTTG